MAFQTDFIRILMVRVCVTLLVINSVIMYTILFFILISVFTFDKIILFINFTLMKAGKKIIFCTIIETRE